MLPEHKNNFAYYSGVHILSSIVALVGTSRVVLNDRGDSRLFCFFEALFLCIAQAVLELTL